MKYGDIRKIVCVGVCCLSSLIAPGVGASNMQDQEGADFPLVLTASRMRQTTAHAPAAITVIDREMIEISGVRQVADLLRLVPGAIVGYNDGNWPVVTLRGLTNTYSSGLQVLIDGVSVYSPLFGGMFWGQLPISVNDIDRLEVVRGPNAASFGANSFQGVVNIITRDPVAEAGTQLHANLGEIAIRDAELNTAGGEGAWHYRATLGQRSDEGFDSRPDAKSFAFANLKGDYQLDHENNLSFSLRAAGDHKDFGNYNDPASPAHPTRGDLLNFQARWSHAESTDNDWWIQFYHQRLDQQDRAMTDLRNLFPPLAPFPVPLPFEIEIDYKNQRDGIELQQNYRWSESLRTVWGAETRRDASRSRRLFGTGEEQSAFLSRIFANAEWRFAEKWTFDPGVMFEHNSLAKDAWSPRLALLYEVAPGQVLRASYSSAKRTPTLLEKYANYKFDIPLPVPPFSVVFPWYLSTARVNSETVYSGELGYVFHFPELALSGDARWFSDRYRGLVANLGRIPFVVGGDYINADDARTTGVDCTMQWRPSKTLYVRSAISHTSTWSTDDSGLYSKSVPQNTLSVLASKTFGNRWTISANYQYVGTMFWTDAGQQYRKIPSIEHLNLKLAKRFQMGRSELELAGVVQNALGQYRDYYLGPAHGTPENIAKPLAFVQLSIDY